MVLKENIRPRNSFDVLETDGHDTQTIPRGME